MLEGLNIEQRRAVEHADGPLLILAGAGSGKTKTLTHRIGNLIANHGVWPNQILALTFTNKAAREMRERLSQLLGQENTRGFMPWMGTFHGICVRLLRFDGAAVGVQSNFVIYDEDDRRGLIKRAMKELSISDKQIKPRTVSSIISGSKNQLIDPEEYAAKATLPYQQSIAKIYSQYEKLRSEAGALDFDDLLVLTVQLFRENPQIRKKWRDSFKHILIDEYQDTNAAQYAIVKYLVNEANNICVVGDDWQSIYSWRGADFTNILNFERDFPGTNVIKLEQNYRSTSAILDAAHQVISKNQHRTDKALWTDKNGGTPVEVHSSRDEAEEAYIVATHIAAQVSIGARDYGDFAVLYRMNSQSYMLERSLMSQRIPYQIIGGVRFYDRREIKDVIAYLRLLYQPRDSMSFLRIANLPARGLGATSLSNFMAWQAQTGKDILAALIDASQADRLTPRAKKALINLGEILQQLQSDIEQSTPPAQIIERLLEKTGYIDMLRDGTPQAEEREANIGALISDAQNFVSLVDLLEEVALMSSADSEGSNQKVTLMTLHAAKGLEFPVVFMVGLEEGVFPHSRVFDSGPEELEEERRLCYVGMTRAREELHMSYASSRLQFGQRTYGQPSRFLSDMGHEITASFGLGQSSWTQQPAVDDWVDTPQLDVGQRVRSHQFGSGDVIDVDGLAVLVQFDDGTTKKLNTEYARLELIN